MPNGGDERVNKVRQLINGQQHLLKDIVVGLETFSSNSKFGVEIDQEFLEMAKHHIQQSIIALNNVVISHDNVQSKERADEQ